MKKLRELEVRLDRFLSTYIEAEPESDEMRRAKRILRDLQSLRERIPAVDKIVNMYDGGAVWAQVHFVYVDKWKTDCYRMSGNIRDMDGKSPDGTVLTVLDAAKDEVNACAEDLKNTFGDRSEYVKAFKGVVNAFATLSEHLAKIGN